MRHTIFICENLWDPGENLCDTPYNLKVNKNNVQ